MILIEVLRRLARPTSAVEPDALPATVAVSGRDSSSKMKPVAPIRADRRNFLKASAALGAVSLSGLTLVAGTRKAAAAILVLPYKLLELPLLGGLSALAGATPVLRRVGAPAGTQAEPQFAYGTGGNVLGFLARHGIESEPPPTSGGDPLVEHWQEFSASAWEKSLLPVCLSGSGLASDGTNRLWQLREGTAVGKHLLRQSLPSVKVGAVYTVNFVLRSTDVGYVMLQLRSFANRYHAARFDLASKSVVRTFGAIDAGVITLNHGLLQVWASFNADTGATVPAVSLHLLDPSGSTNSFAGANRALYLSECWLAEGVAAIAFPAKPLQAPSGGLLAQPADLASSAWLRSGIGSCTPNSGAASDGSNRLWAVRDGRQSMAHLLSQDLPALKTGSTCTINAVVRSDQIRFVGLQLRTFENQYAVVRFDLFNRSVLSGFLARSSGVIPRSEGLVQIWASFDAGAGGAAPAVFLQLLDAGGKTPTYIGTDRTLYFSEMWVNEGLSATGQPNTQPVAPPSVPAGQLVDDVLALGGIEHLSPNDCAGVFAFQYRDGIQDRARIWHTGYGDNDYAAVSVTKTQLIFEKVSSGVVTRCVHAIAWTPGRTYKVGWRFSSQTGMELVLNGRQVASNASAMARRSLEVGNELIIGSDGRRFFSICPIANVAIYSEA